MRLLLATHILLHALTAPERLAPKRSESIENPANAVFVSAVSIAASCRSLRHPCRQLCEAVP